MTRVLVIGGGIAGISVAAQLAPFTDVTVLEAEPQLGYHASARSAAIFEENYGAPAVVGLNQASRSFYLNSGYLSPRGLMLLCKDGEDAAFEADLDTLNCHEIDAATARDMVPILAGDVIRMGYHAEAYDIDTDRMQQDFAKTVRNAGGKVVTGARINALEFDGKIWEARAGAARYKADMVVNAAGAWADEVARLAGLAPLGLTPLRRSMARLPAFEGIDTRNWPMFFGPGESWYAKPDAGGLLVSPAEEDPHLPADVWADDMVIAEALERYSRYVSRPVMRVQTTWAGLRTFTPDRVLALGPDAAEPSFFWCAGQGGYGFSTAPAASSLVADLVLERKPALTDDLIAALSPHRLNATEGALA